MKIALALLLPFAAARIRNQCVQRGMYAMTWDDGPSTNTNELLAILREKDVKATFHVTTQYITDPQIQSMIQRIAAAGHLIGLRAEASWNLMSMTDEQIKAGLTRQANVLAQFIGYVPKFIRLAYNGFDNRVLAAVEDTGLVVTQQNLETYDYSNDGQKTYQAVNLALSIVARGGGAFIAVQHDGVQQSVGVTPKVIDLIKNAGYSFVKLDECLGMGDMTKNNEPLKGASDSVDFGNLSQEQQAFVSGTPLPGGAPSPMAGMDGPDAPAFGNKIKSQFANAASRSAALGSISALFVAAVALML